MSDTKTTKAPKPGFYELYDPNIDKSRNIGNIVETTIRDEDLAALLFASAVEAGRSSRRDIIFNPIPPAFLKDGEWHNKIVEMYTEMLNDKESKRSLHKLLELVDTGKKDYYLLDFVLSFLDAHGGVARFIKIVRKLVDSAETDANYSSFTADDIIRQKLFDEFYKPEEKNEKIKLFRKTADLAVLAFDFMKFSFMINKLTLQKNEMSMGIPEHNTEKYMASDKGIRGSLIKFHYYEVQHSKTVEIGFNKRRIAHGNCFMYHGSGKQNWYSLMSNGIIVASGTKVMTAGAAYGPGIYLSDELSFSLSYSTMNHAHTTPAQKTHAVSTSSVDTDDEKLANDSIEKNYIVAIYEVIGGMNDYKKTTNIYVVPDDSMLILRYLVSLPSKNVNVSAAAISKDMLVLAKNRSASMQTRIKKSMLGWHNRIKKDLKQLSSIANILYDGKKFVHSQYKDLIYRLPEPELCEYTVIIAEENNETSGNLKIKFPLEYPTKPVEVTVAANNIAGLDNVFVQNILQSEILKIEWTLQTTLNEFMLNVNEFLKKTDIQ